MKRSLLDKQTTASLTVADTQAVKDGISPIEAIVTRPTISNDIPSIQIARTALLLVVSLGMIAASMLNSSQHQIFRPTHATSATKHGVLASHAARAPSQSTTVDTGTSRPSSRQTDVSPTSSSSNTPLSTSVPTATSLAVLPASSTPQNSTTVTSDPSPAPTASLNPSPSRTDTPTPPAGHDNGLVDAVSGFLQHTVTGTLQVALPLF